MASSAACPTFDMAATVRWSTGSLLFGVFCERECLRSKAAFSVHTSSNRVSVQTMHIVDACDVGVRYLPRSLHCGRLYQLSGRLPVSLEGCCRLPLLLTSVEWCHDRCVTVAVEHLLHQTRCQHVSLALTAFVLRVLYTIILILTLQCSSCWSQSVARVSIFF